MCCRRSGRRAAFWGLDMKVAFLAGCLFAAALRRSRAWVIRAAFAVLVFLGFVAGSRAESAPDYETLWKHGEYQQALKTVEALIAERGRFVPTQWLADRAELRYETGRIDEAIADFEGLEERYGSPTYLVRLALLYRERGRNEDYLQTLGRAWERARQSARYGSRAELALVQGRIAELQGQNPKTILNTLYAALMEQLPDYLPTFVAAGDLAFRKWDYELAAGYYEKALKIDKANQDALSGLAECYWKSSDSRVDEVLKQILALNPYHPRARAIQAEMALDVGKTDEALRVIDDALAINPVRMRMLALHAAAWFLSDNPTSMAQTQERTLKLYPHGSEVFRVPGFIASRHYRFREGSELQRRALELDPGDHVARAYYAFDLLRLGEEEEGRRQLQQAFEADRYNVTVFNMLNLMDSLARFAVVEREPFALQLPRKEAPILAQEALALLQEAFDTYSRKYGVQLETPIRVQIFDNHDDFMVRSVGLPGSVGHLGICFGRLVTMDSPSARSKWEANWRSVLWHEFVHVVTLQKTKSRLPRWLSEGISVYEETQRNPAWGQRLDVRYKTIVDSESLPGLTDLERYFTQPKTLTHLTFGYLAASEFVRFYVERYGFAALKNALERIGSGRATMAALAESTGASRETLDAEFQTYFKKRLAPYDNLPATKIPPALKARARDRGASVTLALEEWAKIPSPFTDAMRSAREALRAEQWEKAEAALKQAHDLFPDYTGADSPLHQLIALYEKLNRREALRAALRRAIAHDPTDFPSCRQLAQLLEKDQAWPEMIRVVETALSIDPFDVEMRRLAFNGYANAENREKVLETLGQMILLDPAHAVDYRLQRVDALCDLGRWVEAKKEILQVLEEMPYFWDAQNRLLRIVERETKARAERSGR